MKYEEVTERIIGLFYKVYNELGYGFLEKIYERALALEFKGEGLVFEPDSDAMNYKRIFQYNNLYDLEYQLEKVGEFLRNGYNQEGLNVEYKEILKRHSTKARVMTIINEARKIGIL